MASTYKKYSYKNYRSVDSDYNSRGTLRLASARKCAQIPSGVDPKMKIIFGVVVAIFFVFGTIEGATLHSIRDFSPKHLAEASLKELSSLEI